MSALAGIVTDIAATIRRDAAAIEAAADRKEDVAPGPFGIAVALASGAIVTAGDAETGFPIQSISKVFALDMALGAKGDALFDRVGREPSGDPFNSIVDLERTEGIPRNPFVNAGALVVVDMLVEALADDWQASAVAEDVRRRAGLDRIVADAKVLASEQEGGDLNRAMMSFMRHHGNLHSDPDAVMEAYVQQCAIVLDCCGLARAGLPFSATRRHPEDADADAVARRRRRVLALMMTCGHYDGSGDFALRVGVPAKSGVGGGILAIVPDIASVAVWSPNLDQHGNSILGVRALEMLCDRTGWSVFGPPLTDGVG
ncbi:MULTISPECIES: glutaminase A [unclassified Sphingomonas]|uniref:glutaminase A n=1 Tax=unclassified Sphingomonas TaxID=196159 RepID=UPI0025D01531|nr:MULTISPECIES: glutaminase A [unclassified Sphingomonas]